MLRRVLGAGALLALGGCISQTGVLAPTPDTAQAALTAYYNTIPNSALPSGPAGKALPAADSVLSTILIGSCLDEEMGPSDALRSIAAEQADLFLMLGDNVYGDRDGRAYVNNDPDLIEVRQSFADLGARADFQAVRANTPMMVAWDDHDYGANDMGGRFVFKELAERIHEVFWGLEDEDVGQWPGTYYARSFGPEGQRVQVIMLDTRFFRSDLRPTDGWGEKGKERYLPQADTVQQDMLGAAQWTWLENQLQAPADIRIVASSVQFLPTVHGWEAWSQLPAERQRLADLIASTGATGVVFASGDRHTAFLYEDADILPYTAHELTSSSLNVSFLSEIDEVDSRQLGSGYTPENYGAVEIDWDAKKIHLKIKDNQGRTTRQNTLDFAEIGVQ